MFSYSKKKGWLHLCSFPLVHSTAIDVYRISLPFKIFHPSFQENWKLSGIQNICTHSPIHANTPTIVSMNSYIFARCQRLTAFSSTNALSLMNNFYYFDGILFFPCCFYDCISKYLPFCCSYLRALVGRWLWWINTSLRNTSCLKLFPIFCGFFFLFVFNRFMAIFYYFNELFTEAPIAV